RQRFGSALGRLLKHPAGRKRMPRHRIASINGRHLPKTTRFGRARGGKKAAFDPSFSRSVYCQGCGTAPDAVPVRDVNETGVFILLTAIAALAQSSPCDPRLFYSAQAPTATG